jgi:hypothetical protein
MDEKLLHQDAPKLGKVYKPVFIEKHTEHLSKIKEEENEDENSSNYERRRGKINYLN